MTLVWTKPGGCLATYPTPTKLGELFFHSSPWFHTENSMRVTFIYIYTYTYIYIYIYIYIHIYIYFIYICKCVYSYVHIYIYSHSHIHTPKYTHVSAERSPATIWLFRDCEIDNTVSYSTNPRKSRVVLFKKCNSKIHCLSSFLKKRLTKLFFQSRET